MVKLALIPIGALFPVRTWLLDAGARPGTEGSGHFQKVVQGWSIAPIGIIRRHKLIINEGVHEDAFLNDLLIFLFDGDKLSVMVIGDDNCSIINCQVQNVSKVINRLMRFMNEM